MAGPRRPARGSTTSDLDALWDYSDPGVSERRFRRFIQHLKNASNPTLRAEALTQLARAEALQGKFPAAHQTLDQLLPRLSALTPRAKTRYLLERGRVFNSGGAPRKALPLFLRAWRVARGLRDDPLAVDAAHMVAIVKTGTDKRRWNKKGLELAERSADPNARRWRASLLNNIGWSQFDSGEYARALRSFRRALRYRHQQKNVTEIRIARWCVAKTLRLMGRTQEALRWQRRLLQEWVGARRKDGYVFEELGECLLALGRRREASGFFGKAYAELSKDRWLARNESKRLNRLRRLGRSQ